MEQRPRHASKAPGTDDARKIRGTSHPCKVTQGIQDSGEIASSTVDTFDISSTLCGKGTTQGLCRFCRRWRWTGDCGRAVQVVASTDRERPRKSCWSLSQVNDAPTLVNAESLLGGYSWDDHDVDDISFEMLVRTLGTKM